MRIDSAQTIAGQPALKIRKLLRGTRLSSLNVDAVSRQLGITAKEAQYVVVELENAGFVEKKTFVGIDEKEYLYWENTIKGNAVAMGLILRLMMSPIPQPGQWVDKGDRSTGQMVRLAYLSTRRTDGTFR